VINFDDVFRLDLKDDFELAGRNQQEFSIYDFINNDLSKAFVIGFDILSWDLWIPITVKKELRHVGDNLEQYVPELAYWNTKCKKDITTIEYVDFILSNTFCENERDLVNIAISLGLNARKMTKNDK
jgi:hypothetical protein